MKTIRQQELEARFDAVANRIRSAVSEAAREVQDIRDEANDLPNGPVESLFIDTLDWGIADVACLDDIASSFGKDV